jgi:hypothetical protein
MQRRRSRAISIGRDAPRRSCAPPWHQPKIKSRPPPLPPPLGLHVAFNAAVSAAFSDIAAWRLIGSTSVRFGGEPVIRGVIPSDSDRSCATSLILLVPSSCSALQLIASSPSTTVQPEIPLNMLAIFLFRSRTADVANFHSKILSPFFSRSVISWLRLSGAIPRSGPRTWARSASVSADSGMSSLMSQF